MRRFLSIPCLLVCLVCGACGGTSDTYDKPDKQGPATMTKDEARGASQRADGSDFCGRFGWYGDGVCDDFCAQPDSDCHNEATQGACSLTCDGLVYACEVTDEMGCTADAFDNVPRCLYELTWSAGAECASARGACSLTCEGLVYACQLTDETGCTVEAFDSVPRCLYELTWSEDAVCSVA